MTLIIFNSFFKIKNSCYLYKMEDKATRKSAVDDAMNDVRAQVQSCKDTIKELKQERKNQTSLAFDRNP